MLPRNFLIVQPCGFYLLFGHFLHFFPTTGTLWDSCYGINYPYAVCPWVPTIMVTFYPSVRHGFLEKGCRLFKVLYTPLGIILPFTIASTGVISFAPPTVP